VKVVLLAVVLLLVCSAVFAADIVTVPTANQLKAGQMDVAYYYLGLDMPKGAPQSIQAQTLYVGVTDQLEVDFHRYDPEKNTDRISTIVNASVLLMSETASRPSVVVGGRNLGAGQTTLNPVANSEKTSWFLSMAKNVTPMTPQGPKLPLIRVHLSVGTKDNTLLGESRHEGLFGGLQALLTPEIGAVALYDGTDTITGLTFTPKGAAYTIKGGTYGDHWWVGLSYAM
jgi:hypothetical protein